MHTRHFAAPILALLLLTAPASAEPPSAALQLYAAGDYAAAAANAETQQTPEALVLASRALIAACMIQPQARGVDAMLARAENNAARALRLDPNSVDAHLQMAFAMGARARRTSLPQAMAHNYAPRGKRLILQAIALAPDNAQARALLGGWHLEVLRRGGRAGAALYGANLETGRAEFERARALSAHDGLITIQFAIALLQLDPQRYGAEAARLLSEGAANQPRDAFERHAFAEARAIGRVLASRGAQAANDAARAAFL